MHVHVSSKIKLDVTGNQGEMTPIKKCARLCGGTPCFGILGHSKHGHNATSLLLLFSFFFFLEAKRGFSICEKYIYIREEIA